MGTSGPDILRGTDGADLLEGLGGDDWLLDSLGADTLDGGDDDDRFDVRTVIEVLRFATFQLIADDGDAYLGGDGEDSARVLTEEGAAPLGYAVNLGTGEGSNGDTFVSIENFTGTAFDDTIIGSPFDNSLFGGAGLDVIEGGGGADHIEGDLGDPDSDDTLDGGAGDDTVLGRGGFDTVRGGTGDDFLSGSAMFAVSGDPETDRNLVRGDAGNDEIRTYSGLDTLNGGAGRDVFWIHNRIEDIVIAGGGGVDEIKTAIPTNPIVDIDPDAGLITFTDGGVIRFDGIEKINGEKVAPPDPGPDCVFGTAGADAFTATAKAECFDGGAGIDAVRYAGSNAAITIDIAGDIARGGHARGDVLGAIESIDGSRFGDVLRGDSGFNVLRGGGGDDELLGRGGRDRLDGGDGADTIDGGERRDKLIGGDGNDVIQGGDGDDRITGGGNRDTLDGGEGYDRVNGGGGRDLLIGSDRVDLLEGGGGVDKASFAGIDFSLRIVFSKTEWRFGELGGGAAEGLLRGIEILEGGGLRDFIAGSRGDDELHGGGGNDTLKGFGGDDVLFGDKGADQFILGIADSEKAWGGRMRDTFRIFREEGADRHDVTIMDLDLPGRRGGDKVRLMGYDFEDEEEMLEDHGRQKGRDVVIELDALTTLTVRATQLDDLIEAAYDVFFV